jgi:hypothetical protein
MRMFFDTATLLSVLFLTTTASHAAMRRVTVSPDRPAEVRLAYGKTTVLSFSQRPENVVPGAPSQVHIEFLRNDLNVSALGPSPGNLIVYTKTARLVFHLRVSRDVNYDDVVNVTEAGSVRTLRLDRDSYRVEELKLEFHPKAGVDADAFSKTIAVSISGSGKEAESEDLFDVVAEPAKLRCEGCRTLIPRGSLAIRLQCARAITELHCRVPRGNVTLKRSQP